MSLPPESIEVGKCYLTHVGGLSRVQRVVTLTPSGQVMIEVRRKLHHHTVWIPEERSLRLFAVSAECEVPCDWTPEAEGDNA